MVQGKGLFSCTNKKCPNQWTSGKTTLVVDLYLKCIEKKYRQKCKKCMIWITPYFTDHQLEEIMERVLKKYQKRKMEGPGDSTGITNEETGYSRAPHETDLCERCQELGKPCW